MNCCSDRSQQINGYQTFSALRRVVDHEYILPTNSVSTNLIRMNMSRPAILFPSPSLHDTRSIFVGLAQVRDHPVNSRPRTSRTAYGSEDSGTASHHHEAHVLLRGWMALLRLVVFLSEGSRRATFPNVVETTSAAHLVNRRYPDSSEQGVSTKSPHSASKPMIRWVHRISPSDPE